MLRNILVAGLVAVGGFTTLAENAAPRPHIVFVLADDLGWNDIGYHGSRVRSPNLDALAEEGVKLRRYYTLPTCTASRAALLTGRHPIRYGIEGGISRAGVDVDGEDSLPLSESTLAEHLKAHGYRTIICGKWHLGEATPAFRPLQRGFDHHYGNYFGAIYHFRKVNRQTDAPDWYRNGEPIEEEGYVTHLLADEAVRRIKEGQPSTPLFLYMPFTAPHVPIEVPLEYTKPPAYPRLKRNLYAGMVTCLDEAVGKIVRALKEEGYWENTLFVFCSDNGAADYEHGSNRPLRGGKRTVYEGGVRVPAFVVWPNRITKGRVSREVVSVLDWTPTFLKMAGARSERELDGQDLTGLLLRDATLNRDFMLLNETQRQAGALQGDWKIVITRKERNADTLLSEARVELFNLKDDPREEHNLSKDRPDLVRQLSQRLQETARQWRAPR